ncbi:MAG: zinc ABC transporter substrate-binding protein [Lysobacteraceae bacterium]|nr:MAG: zinc ABC transporter substrate-binding protein [Xanthomonadaceae bacterium]
MKNTILATVLSLVALPSLALDIFACEPEWAALSRELLGEQATIYTATTSLQDPHYVQARPSLIAQIRHADLLVCTGADLEVGWLPLLLRRGSQNIQPGRPGHFLAANHVRKLEVPTTIDRSQGDIHPQGNPHVHLNPRNISRIARALATAIKQVDPSLSQAVDNNLNDFEQRWRSARDRWATQAESLAGLPVIAHHRSFSYLADWLNLNVVDTIETKPGIPPASSHLSELLSRFKTQPPALIIRTPYEDRKPSAWLSEKLGAPAIQLPYTTDDDHPTLFALFDSIIGTLSTGTAK